VGVRRGSVDRQSPGLAEDAAGTFKAQLNQYTGNNAKNRAMSSDDMVIYELLKRRGDEQAHHEGILETIDLLYKGLNEKEIAELTNYGRQFHGMGNDIRNLVNIPKSLHIGKEGIHPWAIKKGYQYHSKTKPKNVVEDVVDASEMPLEYRKHILKKYLTETVPEMKDKIDDILIAHPSMHEKLDMSAVREAELDENADIYGSALDDLLDYMKEEEKATRMAGKAMDEDMMRQYLEAGEDLQATGQVIGRKPIVVNADEGANVYVRTNGNGNGKGNGHVTMQREYNRN